MTGAAASTFTNTGLKKENTVALLNNQPDCSAVVNEVVGFINQTKIMIYFSTKLNPDGFEFPLTSLLRSLLILRSFLC
jgi:hypothetical protein